MDNFIYEQKIEKLKAQIGSNELYIGYELIDSFNDTSFANYVVSKADQEFYEYLMKKKRVFDRKLVILGLIIVALKDYDGAFWCYVEDRFYYCYAESDKTSGFVNEKLRDVIRTYYHYADNDSRIISYVLKHAIMPVNFLHNYFELMFDIYRKNMYFYLGTDSEIEEDLRMTFNGISRTGNTGVDDEFRAEATNKVYVLIKSTREVMRETNGIDSLIKLSIDVLRIINAYYNSLDCDLLENNYYKTGLDNWINFHANKIELRRQFGSKKESPGWNFEQSPSFELRNDVVYLNIPARKVRADYDYRNIKVKIYNGRVLLYTEEKPVIEQQIGVYIVQLQNSIRITAPIGQLRYEITCGDDIVYPSGDRLFRKYILFDEKGYELRTSSSRQSGGVIKVVSKDFSNKSIHMLKKTDQYCVGVVDIDEEGFFYLYNELVSLKGTFSSGIIGEKYENTYLIYDNDYIEVRKRADKLVLESDLPAERIYLEINGSVTKLLDYPVTVKKNGNLFNYVIDLDLEDADTYEIRAVDIFDDGQIKNANYFFALDKTLSYERYSGKPVKYTSSLIPAGTLHPKINDEKTFSPIVCFGEDGEYEYSYYFPYGFELVKIDNQWWQEKGVLWGGDLKSQSKIYTYGFYSDQIDVLDSGQIKLGTIPCKLTKTGIICECGTLVSYMPKHKFVFLRFVYKDSPVKTIKCYFSCEIDEEASSFRYNETNHSLVMNVKYIGKRKLLASVNNSNVYIESGKIVEVPGINLFEPVSIVIKEMKFGLSNKPLLSKTITFISLDKLENHSYKCGKFIYEEYRKNTKLDIEIEAKRTYLVVDEKKGDGLYSGRVFVGAPDNRKYLSNINPVMIEVISEEVFNEKYFSASITTMDGDGLFVNKAYNTVLNSDYSKDAPDIVTYELEYAGEE